MFYLYTILSWRQQKLNMLSTFRATSESGLMTDKSTYPSIFHYEYGFQLRKSR